MLTRCSFARGIACVALALGVQAGMARGDTTGDAVKLMSQCQRFVHPGGIRFRCDSHGSNDVLAYVGESETSIAAARADAIAGLEATFHGEVTTSEAAFTARGKTWTGLKLSLRAAGGGRILFEGRIVAFEPGKGVTRLVSCGAAPSVQDGVTRCNRILPALAEAGPAPFQRLPNLPAFLGKTISLPAGCRAADSRSDGFSALCGNTAALTVQQFDAVEAVAHMPTVMRMFGEDKIKLGAQESDGRSCKIGGVATKCRTFTLGRAVTFVGWAVVNRVPVLAECVQQASQKGVHPLCATTMSF
jgi:hypothetical protein